MKKKLLHLFLAMAVLVGCSTSTSTSEEKETETEEIATIEVAAVPDGEVEYSADTTALKGYFATGENSSGKNPGILVIHEWWGHNEHTREKADQLAELGYVALALDMYGAGKNTSHPEDANKFMSAVVQDMDVATARFTSALQLLKTHPNVDTTKIGVIGYCFGGTMALSMANAGIDLDAVAVFHAGLGLPIMPEEGIEVKAKILVQNGADDAMIPEQQVTDFKATMDASGVDYEYVSYPGVVHAFTNKGADEIAEKHEMLQGRIAYDAEADSLSWGKMKTFFEGVF